MAKKQSAKKEVKKIDPASLNTYKGKKK